MLADTLFGAGGAVAGVASSVSLNNVPAICSVFVGAVNPKRSVVPHRDLVALTREFFGAAVKEHDATCLFIVDVVRVAGVDAPVWRFYLVKPFGVFSDEGSGHENVSGSEKIAVCADGKHFIFPLSVVE